MSKIIETRTKKPRGRTITPKGKWVFVPNEDITPEEAHKDKLREVTHMLSLGWCKEHPFAAADQLQNYFPGANKVPEGGAWILVKDSLPTKYTPTPLSIWFAEPWPMENEWHCSHRVKIITHKGEIGLFPREYSIVTEPQKYFEFIGEGMEIKFFGTEDGLNQNVRDQLFYIRSRGVSKRDALAMLIGNVKAHGVMWLEASREVAEQFGKKWPAPERSATN